jgi:hypothetical protein
MEVEVKEENLRQAIASLPVDAQFELAKSLAANCGYQLVADDADAQRVLQIKRLIARFRDALPFAYLKGDRSLIVEGLEGLLK